MSMSRLWSQILNDPDAKNLFPPVSQYLVRGSFDKTADLESCMSLSPSLRSNSDLTNGHKSIRVASDRLTLLPVELLDIILAFAIGDLANISRNRTLYALCRTCRILRVMAEPLLWRDMRVISYRSLASLQSALGAAPALGDRVERWMFGAFDMESRVSMKQVEKLPAGWKPVDLARAWWSLPSFQHLRVLDLKFPGTYPLNTTEILYNLAYGGAASFAQLEECTLESHLHEMSLAAIRRLYQLPRLRSFWLLNTIITPQNFDQEPLQMPLPPLEMARFTEVEFSATHLGAVEMRSEIASWRLIRGLCLESVGEDVPPEVIAPHANHLRRFELVWPAKKPPRRTNTPLRQLRFCRYLTINESHLYQVAKGRDSFPHFLKRLVIEYEDDQEIALVMLRREVLDLLYHSESVFPRLRELKLWSELDRRPTTARTPIPWSWNLTEEELAAFTDHQRLLLASAEAAPDWHLQKWARADREDWNWRAEYT